jgi:BirA family transcriptional regulator, biotin operon repressor / biotin---[acetyl-CoA-carboxylase] ligase
MFAPSPERIAHLLRPAAQGIAVRVIEQTGSTNADLLAELPELAGPTLLVARTQTAGRGRAGRNWYSAAGSSLTFSLAWKFGRPVHALMGLPLAAGVALANALATFNVEVALKWPNDVLFEGKKLAGILIESASANHGSPEVSWAVIGIGINIRLDAQAMREIGTPVASVAWLAEVDQDMLLANVISSLAEMLVQFEHEGLVAFAPHWNRLHAYRGQAVRILDNGHLLHEGIAVGVDEVGRFLLDGAHGRVAVMAGDVSLRLREA